MGIYSMPYTFSIDNTSTLELVENLQNVDTKDIVEHLEQDNTLGEDRDDPAFLKNVMKLQEKEINRLGGKLLTNPEYICNFLSDHFSYLATNMKQTNFNVNNKNGNNWQSVIQIVKIYNYFSNVTGRGLYDLKQKRNGRTVIYHVAPSSVLEGYTWNTHGHNIIPKDFFPKHIHGLFDHWNIKFEV